jgi:hypothetical protein
MVPFLVFAGFLVVLGLWCIHAIRKEEAKQRPIGFVSAGPESRSRSAE